DGTGPYLPSEAFTVAEALDSFTFRGAEASFEEKVKGRIREGQLADFVVLDADPFETTPEAISKIKVVATYLSGIRVY
ncbi:amidohydrolase family protein, partial [bacterium]|nr:amidohydrolase family protein [bacterium]